MNPADLGLYIVDDDDAVRRSLELLLRSKGFAPQTYSSGEAFLAASDIADFGCVVLDMRMVGLTGLQVLDALRARSSALQVLFLSGHGDIPMAIGALQNGAFGWLEKPCPEQELLDKVHQALTHAHQVALRKLAQSEAQKQWSRLTTREKEVARLVADGCSSKEIARQLTPTCDPRTIETHRARIFAKLELPNSNALDRFIREHGL
jgi:FixJ family two-component response regulator